MQLRVLLLAGLCCMVGQAQAGLFNDDAARQQIEQLGTRISTLEESGKQQTGTMLDLQSQIQSLSAEIRTLRGQNEELTHTLQDLDKRQKDFYIDLDTRMRHFETVPESASSAMPAASAVAGEAKQEGAAPSDDPAAANRAYETAYSLHKAGKHEEAIAAFQAFLKNYSDSVYVPNAHFEIGAAYFLLNDYKKALAAYRELWNNYSYSPKAPEALLGIADCQQALKAVVSAQKTLKLLVSKYPDSEAAKEAKKRLEKK